MIDIFEKLKDTANQLNFLKQNLVKNFENNPALNLLKTQLQDKIVEYEIPVSLKFNKETLQFSLTENDAFSSTFSESYFSFGEPSFEPTIIWFKNQLAFCEIYHLLTISLNNFEFDCFEKQYLSNIFNFEYEYNNEFYDFTIYLNHDNKSKIDCLKIKKQIEDDSFHIILDKYNIKLGIGQHSRDDLYLVMESEVKDIDLFELINYVIELINTLINGPQIN